MEALKYNKRIGVLMRKLENRVKTGPFSVRMHEARNAFKGL